MGILNLLAALDKPTAGTVKLGEKELSSIKDADLAAFRRENLGFVFQEFNLLDTFTIADNVYLPLVLAGKSYHEMSTRLLPLADRLGIGDLLDKYPYEVSGGQKQRAAVARALITEPKILLADEPTGALNSKTSLEVLDTFSHFNREGQSIVMVTHDVRSALRGNRIIYLRDGKVLGECNLSKYDGDSVERRKTLNDFLEKMDW